MCKYATAVNLCVLFDFQKYEKFMYEHGSAAVAPGFNQVDGGVGYIALPTDLLSHLCYIINNIYDFKFVD